MLLGLAGSVAPICSGPNRITQENFDRIHEGMSPEEVRKILGKDDRQVHVPTSEVTTEVDRWQLGPNRIVVRFTDGRLDEKDLHLATALEILQWYAKKGAAKVGVKWP